MPPSEWTQDCPNFLVNINAREKSILSQSMVGYQRLSWPAIQNAIQSNQMHQISRDPLCLRGYLKELDRARTSPGGMTTHVRSEVLKWPLPSPDSQDQANKEGFANTSNYKVLPNAYPYAFDESVKHYVVWCNFFFRADAQGVLTQESHHEVANWVRKHFGAYFGEDQVVFWRNPRSSQSVPGLEHFHVLVHDGRPGEMQLLLRLSDNASMEEFSSELGLRRDGPAHKRTARKWISRVFLHRQKQVEEGNVWMGAETKAYTEHLMAVSLYDAKVHEMELAEQTHLPGSTYLLSGERMLTSSNASIDLDETDDERPRRPKRRRVSPNK
jgi:hypothetical protein